MVHSVERATHLGHFKGQLQEQIDLSLSLHSAVYTAFRPFNSRISDDILWDFRNGYLVDKKLAIIRQALRGDQNPPNF
jgi:hypothetical protein